MKRKQKSERIIFYKKLNILKKYNKNDQKLDSIKLCPLIINAKILNTQNSKRLLTSYSNDNNIFKYPTILNASEKKIINNLINLPSNTQEKQIQTNILQKIIHKNEKDRNNKLLIKKVNKFLFSKKNLNNQFNSNSEKNHLFDISNFSLKNNSFNITKYRKIPNIKYSLKNVKAALTTKKFNKYILSNYQTNLTKFNHQIFKYHLFKQKRKFEKLLYNMKKSEVLEQIKINKDLSVSKAKVSNSKHTKLVKLEK